ncbi:MAG: hypothetical protein ACOVP7_10455, partial [Lacibacter sp.]
DSTVVEGTPIRLKGYRKLFYRVVCVHPKLNSPLERALLKHYLLGSGTVFKLSTADFQKMKKLLTLLPSPQTNCRPVTKDYCLMPANLSDDDYFGWALGNITVVYNNDQLPVTFIDRYDFNRKPKGQRRVKGELVTRLFGLIAPRKAKAFLVTYNANAYELH